MCFRNTPSPKISPNTYTCLSVSLWQIHETCHFLCHVYTMAFTAKTLGLVLEMYRPDSFDFAIFTGACMYLFTSLLPGFRVAPQLGAKLFLQSVISLLRTQVQMMCLLFWHLLRAVRQKEDPPSFVSPPSVTRVSFPHRYERPPKPQNEQRVDEEIFSTRRSALLSCLVSHYPCTMTLSARNPETLITSPLLAYPSMLYPG